MVTLKEKYVNEVRPALIEKRELRNRHQAPRLVKVAVNMGIGLVDRDVFKAIVQDLAAITGQQPRVARARKSISNFKLREGMDVGASVTLRGDRMYEFLDRLINVGLPRIRDFRGVSKKGFDGRGNYSLGLQDQTIFPELDPNNVKQTQGMNITIVTTAEDDDGARALLELMGMPFAH